MINTFSETFYLIGEAIKARPRYLNNEGGTRSSKTFSALQWLTILAKADKIPTLTSIVSESTPHLKLGAIRDFHHIISDEFDPERWSFVDHVYTFPNGSQMEFFGADSPGKVTGPGRDRLYLNEANNIRWEIARQLMTRTRGLIGYDYNPSGPFWGTDLIAPRPNCRSVHSTYLNNRDPLTGKSFLPPEQVEEIESYKDDENWWRVYGRGEMGRREGLVYPSFEIIDAMPDAAGLDECYGLDFGFAVSYTAGVRVLLDRVLKIAYIDELFYDRGMLRDDLDAALASSGVPRFSAAPIYCDCARPDTIAELVALGWNATACDKSVSVEEQIGKIQGWKIRVTARSVAGIKELRSYSWKTDKSGNQLGVPVKVWDHFCDAFRYAIHSHTHGGESDIRFEGDAFRREDPEYYDYNDDEYDNDY